MAEIVNLASFIGTPGQELTAADANWSVAYQNGTSSAVISSAARAYQNATPEIVYVRSETPGSANQTVTATIHQVTALAANNHIGVVARKQDGANTYIVAQLRSESGGRQVRVYSIKNLAATQIGGNIPVTTVNGNDYVLQLEVTGQAPNISVVAKLDGVTQISGTVTDAAFDPAGIVGIRFGYGTTASSDTGGLHLATFSASDDTGGSTVPVSFAGSVSNQTGTEGAAFSLNLSTYFSGTETPFAYSVQAGTLPAGLSLNTSTGVISGTPTTAGVSSGIVIRATDATPDTADTNSFSITINAANTSPSFTGPNIDNISGTEGVALAPVDVSASFFDSESGLTFSAIGSWPAGVTVSSAGVISGTPTTAGTYAGLQVRATDAGALTADSNAFTITVAAPLAAVINVTEPLKNNTGTLLASLSGVRVAVLQAADLVSVYETSGLTTNASGVLATISDAAITAGQQYHVAIKLADGGVGITGPITAS